MQKEITPHQSGLLQVSKLHKINYAAFGNPKGIPLLSFHGGPGGKFKSKYAAMMDLEKYYVIMFDQRGCGGSLPAGEIKENTTNDIPSDAEKLLNHLKVKKCVVTGLSWGSTLALAFAEKYPTRTISLIIGLVFVPLKNYNSEWFLGDGLRNIFPQEYDELMSVIKTKNAKELFRKFESAGAQKKKEITAAIQTWESVQMKGLNPIAAKSADEIEDADICAYRIFLHYTANDYFGIGNSIMKNIGKLNGIPVRIIHGEFDFSCPMSMAWDLKKKLQGADFTAVPYEGHGGRMITELFFRTVNQC